MMRLVLCLLCCVAGAGNELLAQSPGVNITPKVGKLGIAVYGKVTSRDGTLLKGVTVDILVPGKGVISTVDTDELGRYVFRADPDEPFDLLMTHVKYNVVVIEQLTFSDHQQISVTLWEKGSKLPPAVAHSLFQSFDRIAFHSTAGTVESRPKFQLLITDAQKNIDILTRASTEQMINFLAAKKAATMIALKNASATNP